MLTFFTAKGTEVMQGTQRFSNVKLKILTNFWIDLLIETNYLTLEDRSGIKVDANEILRILVLIVKKAKQ
jgi:hypothetical protein